MPFFLFFFFFMCPQVLKKRDEENTATISQQKRKITRLQDTHNTLNSRLAKQVKAQRAELQALMEEYCKNTEQYRDVQKKAKHFQLSDAKRFHDVWTMNEEKAQEVAKEVAQADSIIHRQQLGLEWAQPPEIPSPMTHVLTSAKAKVSQATLYAAQILTGTTNDQQTKSAIEKEEGKKVESLDEGEKAETRLFNVPSATKLYAPAVVKRVLELLCSEAEFLLDKKLIRLLAPLEAEEKMMMRLDSMFKALGIRTEEDIQRLAKFFILEEEDREEGKGDPFAAESAGSEEASVTTTVAPPTLIHPNDIPSALRQFVEQRKFSSKPAPSTPNGVGPSTAMQKELLDGVYWQQITGVLPESHEQLWNALMEGLQQYHSVLATRSQCIEETKTLRIQNSELKQLLRQYMHSEINMELQVPPTLMLPTASGIQT